MAKPLIIKANSLVYYLDAYLHGLKLPKNATKLEKRKLEVATQCVDLLKEMFMTPFSPKPGCRTPWYGGSTNIICRTPWMGRAHCTTPWMGKGA